MRRLTGRILRTRARQRTGQKTAKMIGIPVYGQQFCTKFSLAGSLPTFDCASCPEQQPWPPTARDTKMATA